MPAIRRCFTRRMSALTARLRAAPIRSSVAIALGLGFVALAARPGALGGSLTKGVAALGHAQTTYFWIAGACFVVSLLAASGAWKTTLEGCGARLGMTNACARYGVGSLVNTFTPLRLGDGVRLILFSRTLRQDRNRALTTGGALSAIELARALVQTVLVAVAASVGALPLWPVLVLGGVVSSGVLSAFLVRRRLPRQRLEHLLTLFVRSRALPAGRPLSSAGPRPPRSPACSRRRRSRAHSASLYRSERA